MNNKEDLKIINENWDLIKDNLRKEFSVSETAFELWIKPLTLFKVENNTVFIFTERSDFIDYLNMKYDLSFKHSISEFLKKEVDIEFISFSDIDSSINTVSSKKEDYSLSNVDKELTFDSFVVGNHNKMAYAGAVAVAESPGHAYNPLYIYSGVGLGKTHLMNAIANHVIQNDPNKKVLYTTAEDFANELIRLLATGKGSVNLNDLNDFRDKYRNVDVLLIDDIQFVIGKERSQEEFFYTFNTLISNKKQVVISSDKHPKDLNGLDNRYLSRFVSGLMTEIDLPDYETRMAILEKKMINEKLTHDQISNEVLSYIAENVKNNVRELEGCFSTIKHYMFLTNGNHITLEEAKSILKDNISTNTKREITTDTIIEFVSDQFDINPSDIKGKSRKDNISKARHICMYLSRQYTSDTLDTIGEKLGGFDHSSVLYGINKVRKMLNKDYTLSQNIDLIVKKINPDVV